ncbi:Transcription factor SFP1 [Wickerhamiella sorbophila]|uniref:Transcription factor SFP1 n=1 Tax=Wickerhamiella sorbophila TaxID=45607 RepID=A0A2T0FGN4_9ASCO|nr:Transcription factor SFP1 [Wickerhamiella sorbophila]PRT54144.1 Transcription factor SFP1 [Wickerhamiella sorbophila]
MSTVPIDISYRSSGISSQFSRENFAHSQGMGGISWGGHSIGSWLREEALLNTLNTTSVAGPMVSSASPMDNSCLPSYLPSLEADFCRDYNCCGNTLPTLHDLLRHYEDSHISPSPPIEPPVIRRMQNLEMVSTNEVFLAPNLGGVGGGGGGTTAGLSGSGISGNSLTGTNSMGIANANSASNGVSLAGTPVGVGSGLNQSANGPGVTPSGLAGGPAYPAKNEADMCIDDPARQLYVMERSDNRPYRCPVIGCDKTYKNQNGLKYHRLHGHQNQTLHLNEDGTYSIIDPLSNTPYPDGMGMEKDKPYRCEICGKRYKNLNGLKYHRAHSTH